VRHTDWHSLTYSLVHSDGPRASLIVLPGHGPGLHGNKACAAARGWPGLTAIRLQEIGCLQQSIHNRRSLWPGSTQGCPVEGNRLSAMMHSQPKIPVAGLDPAIHISLDLGDLRGQDVDARNKSGQSVLTVVLWPSSLDPALSRSFNRTSVGSTRPSTSSWALVILAAKMWIPGTSPGKAYLQLRRGSHRSILRCRNLSIGQPRAEGPPATTIEGILDLRLSPGCGLAFRHPARAISNCRGPKPRSSVLQEPTRTHNESANTL
jgi:hypothetical protein